jgi:hypothetical protein
LILALLSSVSVVLYEKAFNEMPLKTKKKDEGVYVRMYMYVCMCVYVAVN